MELVAGVSFVELLSTVFSTLFSQVLAPVLTKILHMYIEYVLTIFWAFWSEWLLGLFIALCSLVDFAENIFNIFAGISPVYVNEQKTYLLDAFFQMEKVSAAFTSITVMAVAISFIFTIFKTAKSISDMAMEDRNPISKVLANGMKAAVTFMLIPFLCIAMLQLSSIVTSQAVAAFTAGQGGSSSVGCIIFLSASMDADRETSSPKNILDLSSPQAQGGSTHTLTDGVRLSYLEGKKDYHKLSVVKKDFYASNFNYVEGFVSAVLLLLILLGAVMVFIRRIFELLLLYLVSPFFVSTIPLDDGVMFKKWRELFIAKFFSGFGIIFSMRFYLLIIPAIANSNLCLYAAKLPNAAVINSVLKMFLIIGGAWAVYKSQHLIMQILNPEAASADEQASALMKGIIVGSASTAASMAMSAASGGATTAMGALGGGGNPLGMLGSALKDSGGSKGSGDDDKQKYTGKR